MSTSCEAINSKSILYLMYDIDISKYRAWFFDGDGVLYTGNTPIPHASKFLEYLKSSGGSTALLTNNSTATLEQYKSKVQKMGMQFDEILTSAYTAIDLLDAESAYVIGEEGIFDACRKAGIRIVEKGTVPDVVIVGMDRTLTYNKLSTGVWYILQGARFIATNPDRTFPLNDRIAPGAGSMIAAVTACVDKNPEFIAGKPSPHLYKQALERFNLQPSEVVMIGDRYETDILGAAKLGIDSILVRTGIASRYSESKLNEIRDTSFPPTYIVDSLDSLRILN